MSNPDTTRRVALVTGGAQRIGAEICRQLHAAGLDLLLHYRSSTGAAQALADQLTAARADSVRLVQADLLDDEAPQRLADAVHDWRGRLDLLVNNASGFYPTPFGEVDAAQWEELLGSNLRAPFFLAQALAPLLRASRGAIVNLVDIHAERPMPNHPVYSIAKLLTIIALPALAIE